eukprot:TRINITY_DN20692_c0_g1_i1.p2 TRINITY_DN20692_c0_g1~~TRINITY_DN20692_c0_g1_i1.p2  ORF type:complete len:127 (-),score=11.37 TRINITY_DN20692_c0_g1_i1:894-1274(-)
MVEELNARFAASKNVHILDTALGAKNERVCFRDAGQAAAQDEHGTICADKHSVETALRMLGLWEKPVHIYMNCEGCEFEVGFLHDSYCFARFCFLCLLTLAQLRTANDNLPSQHVHRTWTTCVREH